MQRSWLTLLNLCLLTVCLTGCFQQNNGDTVGQSDSAIDVKNKTKTLDFKSLSEGQSTVVNYEIVKAFKNKKSDVWVSGSGEVIKMLSDDNKGSRHQRFLVRISSSQTLLFAHNIDLAPRLNDLEVGDSIRFKGEYVYNPKGGIVHWTHKDPKGQHQGGWIKHNQSIYE